jgi:polyphosphate kinase
VWSFLNGGDEEFYIGSADWMPRNLDWRVEAVAPIEEPQLHPPLRSLLATYLADDRQAWELDAMGRYRQRMPEDGGVGRGSHRLLLGDPWGLGTAGAAPAPLPGHDLDRNAGDALEEPSLAGRAPDLES